jgi:hypothetical protein
MDRRWNQERVKYLHQGGRPPELPTYQYESTGVARIATGKKRQQVRCARGLVETNSQDKMSPVVDMTSPSCEQIRFHQGLQGLAREVHKADQVPGRILPAQEFDRGTGMSPPSPLTLLTITGETCLAVNLNSLDTLVPEGANALGCRATMDTRMESGLSPDFAIPSTFASTYTQLGKHAWVLPKLWSEKYQFGPDFDSWYNLQGMWRCCHTLRTTMEITQTVDSEEELVEDPTPWARRKHRKNLQAFVVECDNSDESMPAPIRLTPESPDAQHEGAHAQSPDRTKNMKTELLTTRITTPSPEGLLKMPPAIPGVDPEYSCKERPPWKRTDHPRTLEDEVYGAKALDFPTARRPREFRLALSDVDSAVIDTWAKENPHFVGDAAITEAMRHAAFRLLYTWRGIFVKDLRDLPATDLIEHRIPIRADARPVHVPQGLTTPKETEYQQKRFPIMLEAGILRHCLSPWSARTQYPLKKGDRPDIEDQLRMVHNYKPLNAATIKDAYPMKRMEPILNAASQKKIKVFFQCDASSGYWAVPIYFPDCYKTAFNTFLGQLCYTRMGMGVTGGCAIYARLKDIVIGAIPSPNPEPLLAHSTSDSFADYFQDDDVGGADTF